MRKESGHEPLRDFIQLPLFPETVTESQDPKSSIVRLELHKKSFFQLSKKVRRLSYKIDFPGGKHLVIVGYVNSYDQDNLLIIQQHARKSFGSGLNKDDDVEYRVYIPQTVFFDFHEYPHGKGGGYHKNLMDSFLRLTNLGIRHNFFPNIQLNIHLFRHSGYDEASKKYFFTLSEDYMSLLKDSKSLKSIDLRDYFNLKLDFSRILFLPLKANFDHPQAEKIKKFKLITILENGNKKDWIAKFSDKKYFRDRINRVLIPTLKEFEDKKYFKFSLIKGSKNDLESVWEVERLYKKKKEIQAGNIEQD